MWIFDTCAEPREMIDLEMATKVRVTEELADEDNPYSCCANAYTILVYSPEWPEHGRELTFCAGQYNKMISAMQPS